MLKLVFPGHQETHSGGSNRTSLLPKHGAQPPTARRTFIPPLSSREPRLPIPVTLAFDTATIDVNSSTIGDPFSRLAEGGLGMRDVGGIGDHGCCRGIGEAPAGPAGVGGVRDPSITPPQVIYKVEPEFSEEARKAKYQGVVVLAIEVDSNGRVQNPRILRHLGLGLDERAIEAVSRWRFRPAYRNGKPVSTEAVVQVTFQLL